MSSSADLDAAEVRLAPVPDLRLVQVPASVAEIPEQRPAEDVRARVHDRARADGYAAGYFRGIAESRRRAADELARMREELAQAETAAAARREADLAAAVAGLRQAAAALSTRTDAIRTEVVADAADLAAVLVEAILGHELGRLDAETAAADLVRRVVAALGDLAAESPGHGDAVTATVRLCPEVLAVVSDTDREQLAVRGARLVGDPSVQPHDAIVDAVATRVDLRLASTVQRVQAALRGESS